MVSDSALDVVAADHSNSTGKSATGKEVSLKMQELNIQVNNLWFVSFDVVITLAERNM